jgi:hypothetical protein
MDAIKQAIEALETLLDEAESFTVSGVNFSESCFGHKGPALARAALAALREVQAKQERLERVLLAAKEAAKPYRSIYERQLHGDAMAELRAAVAELK